LSKTIKPIQKQVQDILDQMRIKVDFDTLQAKVGNYKWQIKADGHVDPIREKVIKLQDDYKEKMLKFDELDVPQWERIQFAERINKQILETLLQGFNYDDAVKNPEIGPVVLDFLTKEVAAFLAMGGKAGYQHSLMLSNLASLAISNGMLDSKKSTQPSSFG